MKILISCIYILVQRFPSSRYLEIGHPHLSSHRIHTFWMWSPSPQVKINKIRFQCARCSLFYQNIYVLNSLHIPNFYSYGFCSFYSRHLGNNDLIWRHTSKAPHQEEKLFKSDVGSKVSHRSNNILTKDFYWLKMNNSTCEVRF